VKSGRFVKIKSCIALLVLMTGIPFAKADARTVEIFDAQNYPGAWTLVTNSDSTITATETAVHRQGAEVYSRVLQLKAVAEEISRADSGAATEADIRQFIRGYRPPAIPYTSAADAEKTGREQFTCLEFAEDLVKTANAGNIPAQVIGIKFEGELTGHAIAGFPTAEGGMLYFDSTPGADQISHAAHEAQVQVGQPYHRMGGGELAVVGKLPISEIIPVTRLIELANNFTENQNSNPGKTTWVVANENHVQAKGIDYAGPDTLRISDDQLAKWNKAADEFLAVQAYQQDKQKSALQNASTQAAARALAENEQLAAGNDVYGQLRMGERYLTGDGVEKNPGKARFYLQQAADQGSPTAIRELKTLAGQTVGKTLD
jgi:TPR repeat protein